MVDVSSATVTDLARITTGFPTLSAWSPNNKSIAFTFDFDINVVETENKSVHNIPTSEVCGGMFGIILWSPDGKWIAHSHYGNGRYSHGWVCISSLDKGNVYLNVNGHASMPVWDHTGAICMLQ